MSKKGKRAVTSAQVQTPKVPKSLRSHLRGEASDALYWRVVRVDSDHAGEFGWHLADRAAFQTILQRLAEAERKSWKEICNELGGGGERRMGALNKFIPVEALSDEARARLVDLDLDDQDQLFRFRLGNKGRLWGVVDDGPPRCFLVLWWDPEHKVCPSADP